MIQRQTKRVSGSYKVMLFTQKKSVYALASSSWMNRRVSSALLCDALAPRLPTPDQLHHRAAPISWWVCCEWWNETRLTWLLVPPLVCDLLWKESKAGGSCFAKYERQLYLAILRHFKCENHGSWNIPSRSILFLEAEDVLAGLLS
jgi:hypothetical protein